MATVIERADAIAHVKAACAWDQTPAVDETVVNSAVDAAARPDPAGAAVEAHDDPDRTWRATYDLNAACAAVWEAKAALAAARYDLTVDGQSLDRSQLYDHCTKMANRHRSRIAGTIRRGPVGPGRSTIDSFRSR